MISPGLFLVWAGIALVALAILQSVFALLFFSASLLILGVAASRSVSLIFICLRWTIPFAIPLFIMHGVLNPSFEVTQYWLEVIPLRYGGFEYGVIISLRVALVTVVAATLLHVDRDSLWKSLVAWRVPLPLLVVAAQGMSTMGYLVRRSRAIYLAQRARGIAVGPGFMTRLRVLPTVVIPLIVSTLVDAHIRATALVNRGMGSGEMGSWHKAATLSMPEKMLAVAGCLSFLISLMFNKTS